MAAEVQEFTPISGELLEAIDEVEESFESLDSLSAVPRLRALWRDRHDKIALLARYATTSVVAFGVSEVTLLVLYGRSVAGATVCTLIANIAGTIPSYFMSRYWIWKDADRSRAGRQAVLYWTTSAIFIALTSLSTGGIAKLAPAGHQMHLEVVAVAFPAVTVFFWVAKLVVYQKIIFRSKESVVSA